jgi:dihydrofolate synthase/folylpolyglutamate synthase
VHVYTSPHLVRFHERIAIAGADGKAQPSARTSWSSGCRRTQRVVRVPLSAIRDHHGGCPPQAFADHPADALILEVGLGGRLDATNVVTRPALSVITPVAMDHTEKLGDSLAKIAWEKAGILKPGVIAVISAQSGEAMEAIAAHAKSLSTPLFVGQRLRSLRAARSAGLSERGAADGPALAGPDGRHQIINAGTAIAAALHLKPLGLANSEAIERGLTEVRWPARMQHLSGGSLARLLCRAPSCGSTAATTRPADGNRQTLADMEERSPKPVGLVLGMMGNKDALHFLAHFSGLVRRIATVPISDAPAAAHDPAKLAAVAQRAGFAAAPAADVEVAIRHLQEAEGGPLRILICGSLYLAGQVLALQEGVQAQAN